ncbi:MAG: hypothetical protein GXP49_08400 [Deltaproteobacteria bacterium]|nr:hypothetical protein [Deltaproteobacteria bacterium]
MAKDFDSVLKDVKRGKIEPVYLFLCEDQGIARSHARQLLDQLLPAGDRSSNLSELEGAGRNASDVVMQLKTGSLMPGPMVVAWFDADVFDVPRTSRRSSAAKDVTRLEELMRRKEINKAAGLFLAISARLELDASDFKNKSLTPDSWLEKAGMQPTAELEDVIQEVADFVAQNNIEPQAAQESAKVLTAGLDAGFNPLSVLLMTARKASSTDILLKKIQEKGVVLKIGQAYDSRSAKKEALRHLNRLANRMGLELSDQVLAIIAERSTPDPELLRLELEKVAALSSTRGDLSGKEVAALVHKTREEPLWELTSAVSDRNLDKAVAEVLDRLDKNIHPLVILAAVTNEWRRVCYTRLIAGDLVQQAGKNPNLLGTMLKEKVSAKQDPLGKELLGARKPYSLGLLVKRAGRFKQEDLLHGFARILEADIALKKGSEPSKSVLCRLMFSLLS